MRTGRINEPLVSVLMNVAKDDIVKRIQVQAQITPSLCKSKHLSHCQTCQTNSFKLITPQRNIASVAPRIHKKLDYLVHHVVSHIACELHAAALAEEDGRGQAQLHVGQVLPDARARANAKVLGCNRWKEKYNVL